MSMEKSTIPTPEQIAELSAGLRDDEVEAFMVTQFRLAYAKAAHDREQNPGRRMLIVTSVPMWIPAGSPRETYEKLTGLLAEGFTFDQIEWEEDN